MATPTASTFESIDGSSPCAWSVNDIAVHGTGPKAFVARARELAERYGDRFEPPASLVEKAERGELYLDEQPVAA